MSETTAISVRNIGKCYRIGAAVKRPASLTEAAKRLALAPVSYLRQRLSAATEEETLWALRNVSFDVKKGEVVGVIGRNGAGKSTLLKILSRITDPTEGEATVRGRLSSLLEVGTGFHAELTGRENIYLSAAIHGMRKSSVDAVFDKIVDFSGIDRFIDTPVKRYSSGMHVRLGFAVAAHLEPEVLLVDEVLAVGDIAFQRKCLGQMQDVVKQGRAVLFVSHNMAAVSSLCSRLILLGDGNVIADGPTEDVMPLYIDASQESLGHRNWPQGEDAPGDDVVTLRAVRIVSEGTMKGDVPIDAPVVVEMEYENHIDGVRLMSAIGVTDHLGAIVFSTMNATGACTNDDPWFDRPRPCGRYVSRCTIPGNFLNDRVYRVTVLVLSDGTNAHVYEQEAISFRVHETGAMRSAYRGAWLGVVRTRMHWETEQLSGGV